MKRKIEVKSYNFKSVYIKQISSMSYNELLCMSYKYKLNEKIL